MRLLKLLIAFVVCLSLSIAVCAHPGRTDSKGGHTNHDTGEYHYHHGYSAHQHYDQDGDGTLDCPYAFTDKTGSSSGNGKSSNHSSKSSDKSKPKQENRSIVFYVGIVAMLYILWCYIEILISPIIDAIKRRFRK